MTKLEFARQAKVNPSSITYGVRQGRIVASSDGSIDPTDPVNTLYLARHSVDGQGAGARTAVSSKKNAPSADLGREVESVDPAEGGPLAVRLIESKIALANAQRDGHRQRQAERFGRLIDIGMVRQAFSKIGAELSVGFVNLPDRVAAQIVATAIASPDTAEAAVKELLRADIAKTLARVKEVGVDDLN